MEKTTKEKWLPVSGFPELYQVSNLGGVRSIDRIVAHRNGKLFLKKGKTRATSVSPNGYSTVSLGNGKSKTTRYVHRMVAEAFIGPPTGSRLQVNHINGVRNDNRAENLEWCTPKENMIHSSLVLGTNRKGRPRRLSEEKIDAVWHARTVLGYTIRQAAEMLGVSVSSVNVATRKKKEQSAAA